MKVCMTSHTLDNISKGFPSHTHSRESEWNYVDNSHLTLYVCVYVSALTLYVCVYVSALTLYVCVYVSALTLYVCVYVSALTHIVTHSHHCNIY